jgi:hypothetical protein
MAIGVLQHRTQIGAHVHNVQISILLRQEAGGPSNGVNEKTYIHTVHSDELFSNQAYS